MAFIGNGAKKRPKDDEERIVVNKAPSLTAVAQAKESRKKAVVSANAAANEKLAKEKNKKWYSGDKPTARETVARMYEVADGDKAKFQELEAMYNAERSNRSSVIYNPYTSATNYKELEVLAAAGFDVSGGVTPEWLQENMWLKEHGRTNTGYSALAPSKSSSSLENAAWAYENLVDAEERTVAAETELAAMATEAKYWADLGYSDNEIVKRLKNNDAYGTLWAMDEERLKGDAVRLNRAVNYSGEDTMYGMIWAARNNGGSGDYFVDAVKYTMGQGTRYKADPNSEAARDPSNYEGYHPYIMGSTLHDLNQKYGVTGIDQQWLNDNRWMLNDPDKADDYREYSRAFEKSEKASSELAMLDQWIAQQMEKGVSEQDMLDTLEAAITDGGEIRVRTDDGLQTIKLSTLAAMEDDRRNGTSMATAYAIDFTLPRYIDKVTDMYAEQAANVPAKENDDKGAANSFENWASNVRSDIGYFFAASTGGKVGSYGTGDAVVDAQVGADNPQEFMSNFMKTEFGVDFTGELTEAEQQAVTEAITAMDVAKQPGASKEERAAAEEAAQKLFWIGEALFAQPHRHVNYQDEAAYTSVMNNGEDEDLAARGMLEGEYVPQAYMRDAGGSGGAMPAETAEGYTKSDWEAMLRGSSEWDSELFAWALDHSDNPDLVLAELREGIAKQMMGERGTATSESWMQKFKGLTGDDTKYQRAEHQQLYGSHLDTRKDYGTAVYEAVIANEEALSAGVIDKEKYIDNLLRISIVADSIGVVKGNADDQDEHANAVLASGDGSAGAYLAEVTQECTAAVEKKREEDANAAEIAETERVNGIASARKAFASGEALSMEDAFTVQQIMTTDVSEAARADETYQQYAEYLEIDAPEQMIAQAQKAYADLRAGDGMTYVGPGDFVTAYNDGVSMIADWWLNQDMQFAASMNMSLAEYYEAYPEYKREKEQLWADAAAEYERQWGELAYTEEGMAELNAALHFMGSDSEEATGPEGEQVDLTFADVFAYATSAFANDFDMALAKSWKLIRYDWWNEEETEANLRSKYSEEDLRREWDEWAKTASEEDKAWYDAMLSSSGNIYELGHPKQIKLEQDIAEYEAVGREYDKFISDNGTALEKFAYKGIRSAENSITMMATTAAAGGSYVGSVLAMVSSAGASMHDRLKANGGENREVVLAAGVAELLVNAFIEKIGFDRIMSGATMNNMQAAKARADYVISKKGWIGMLKDPQAVKTVIKGIGSSVATNAAAGISGGLEETAQGVVTSLADGVSTGKSIIPNEETIKSTLEEFLMGFIMEFGMNVAGAGGGGGHTFTDVMGNEISTAEAVVQPEHDGNIINSAIEFEATAAAIQASADQLNELMQSPENKALEQAATTVIELEEEATAADAAVQEAMDAQANAALALENLNVEALENDAFAEDMAKQMTKIYAALDEANKRVADAKSKQQQAHAKLDEATAQRDELQNKVQMKFREILDAAKAKAEQEIADKYYNGNTEEQKAASEKYRAACAKLAEAKAKLSEARAVNDRIARGRALLAVDALEAEVEAAKAEMEEAFANAPESKVAAEQQAELSKAQEAAEKAAAEADTDQMNAKKQAFAELSQRRLEAVKAKQDMESKRSDVSTRLRSSDAKVRADAVAEWKTAQQEAEVAAQLVSEAEALYNETDAQKRLREALADVRQYTNEQLLFEDAEGHAEAVAAYNRLSLARADAEVEAAAAKLDTVEIGTPEHTAAKKAYDGALEAREDEIGRQIGTTGDVIREKLRQTSLGAQVLEAVQNKDGKKAAKIIKNILDSGMAETDSLIKQAVKQVTSFELLPDAETGATGKAGVTHAYTKDTKLDATAKMQLKILEALAKDLGYEIVVKNSLSNVEGAVNGVLGKGGTIYIGLDAIEQGYLQAGTHEIVHGIKLSSVEAFNELAEVIKGILSDKGLDIDQLVSAKIEGYARLGKNLSETDALEEIVAESTAQIWSNQDNLAKFANEHKGLFKRLLDGITQFWQKVRDIAVSVAQKNRNTASQVLLDDIGALAKIYDTFMEVAKNVGVEIDSNADSETIDKEMNNEKFSLNLNKNEFAQFYRMVGDIQAGEGAQFERSTEGEYIFAIGNKLVYTDGNYDNPQINRVISINLADETDIDIARSLVYDSEKGEYTYEQAGRIAESVFGQENVLRTDYGIRGAFGRRAARGTYRDSGKVDSGNRGGNSYSLNESIQNEAFAVDLADQLINSNGNAAKIADILSRMSDNMWRDHRSAGKTGQQTEADQNPIEILSDLTRSIRVGYNPGGDMSSGNRRLPRAVQAFYAERARAITSRTSVAGDLTIGLHEFGHAVQARLEGLNANQQLLDGLSPEVRSVYSGKELNGEAIAEFVVDYIYSRDEAIRQAGEDFVLQFEEMLRSDRDLNNAINRAIERVGLWNNATVESKIDAMVKDGNDPRRGQIGNWLSRTLRNVETAVFDLTAPADLVSRDFRQRALYSMHAARRADMSLKRFMIDPQGRRIGKSLAERFYDAGVTESDQDAVVRYALARHALDRRAQNKDVFSPAEFSTEDLESIVNNAPENIVAGADALVSFWNDFMDAWWVNTGMIDRASVQRMREMYPHYVPTFRVVGENFKQYGGKSSRFNIREAVEGGSSLEVINPIISIVKMTQQMTSTVAHNELMRAFHNEYRKGGLGEIAEDVSQMYRVQRNNTADLEQALAMIQATGMVDSALMDDAYAEVLNLQERWYGIEQNTAPNVVSGVDEYGTPFFYKIKDGAKGLYGLLSGSSMRADSLGAVWNGFKKFKNTFTKLTTGSNPIFAIKNMERDIQSSVNTGTYALTYVDGMVRWIGALYDVLTNAELYQEWQAMGGGEHTRFNTELGSDNAKALTRALGKELFRGSRNRNGDFSTSETALKRISNFLTWEQFNNAIENASRYVEYKYGKHDLSTQEGRMEAYMRSQDVTTNFGTHGAMPLIRYMNQIVPFMNATLQGLNKDIHIMTDLVSRDANVRRQAAPKAAKMLMNTALTAALQYALLRMFKGKDDDEDYALLTQDMRTGNLIIPIPEGAMKLLGDATGFDKPYVRIPIAQGPLARSIYAASLDAVANVTDYSPMEVEWRKAANAILSDSIPDGTVFQAMVDVANNRTWYGGEIESEYMRENYSEGNRFDNDTPQFVISLARKLGTSPVKLDYLLNQYSGFAGKIIMPMLSPDSREGKWTLTGAGQNLANSVLKNYTIDPVSSNNLSSNYSSAKDTIAQIIGDGKAGLPMNHIAYSVDPEKAYDAAVYLNKEFSAIDKQISALWSEYHYIRESDLSDGDASRRQREIIRNEIIPLEQDALALYEEYKMKYIDADTFAQEIVNDLSWGIEHPTID